MKSICLCLVVMLLAGCATIHEIDGTKLSSVSVSQAQDAPEKWEKIGKQIAAGKTVVVFIEAGQVIPLKLSMFLPMAELISGQNEVKFTRDTYMLIAPKKLLISPDGQRWAAIQDFKAQKKLYGFDKGSISVGFQMTKETGPLIPVKISTRSSAKSDM